MICDKACAFTCLKNAWERVSYNMQKKWQNEREREREREGGGREKYKITERAKEIKREIKV